MLQTVRILSIILKRIKNESAIGNTQGNNLPIFPGKCGKERTVSSSLLLYITAKKQEEAGEGLGYTKQKLILQHGYS